jgi:hypothetical protein
VAAVVEANRGAAVAAIRAAARTATGDTEPREFFMDSSSGSALAGPLLFLLPGVTVLASRPSACVADVAQLLSPLQDTESESV